MSIENNFKLKVLFQGNLPEVTGTGPSVLYSPGVGKQAEILGIIGLCDNTVDSRDIHLFIGLSAAAASFASNLLIHHDTSHNNSLFLSYYPGSGIPLSGTDRIIGDAEGTGSCNMTIWGRESIL